MHNHPLFEPDDVERVRLRRMGAVGRLSHTKRAATPKPFRDLLLAIARTAAPPAAQVI